MLNVKQLIADIEFNNDITFPSYWDITNPRDISLLINYYDDIDMSDVQKALDEFNSRESTVSKDDMKKVFTMLKNRELHPMGGFDKQGRFYLSDSELVDVRAPSTKYPYSQMNAGRTSKFVKAIAEKYKCASFDDLVSRFRSA